MNISGNENWKKVKKMALLFEFSDFVLTKLVAKLVVFNSGMTFNPVPGYVETGIETVQLNP